MLKLLNDNNSNTFFSVYIFSPLLYPLLGILQVDIHRSIYSSVCLFYLLPCSLLHMSTFMRRKANVFADERFVTDYACRTHIKYTHTYNTAQENNKNNNNNMHSLGTMPCHNFSLLPTTKQKPDAMGKKKTKKKKNKGKVYGR